MSSWQYFSALASYAWRVRHAGLVAIAAIGEGAGTVRVPLVYFSTLTVYCRSQAMKNDLGRIFKSI